MKRIFSASILSLILIASFAFGADQRVQCNPPEHMAGANCPPTAQSIAAGFPSGFPDTVDRLSLVEHNIDGSHFSGVDARTGGGLNNTVATIGTGTNATIIVSNPQTLSANLVIPSNISLVVLKQGVINSNGFALTINGPFSAGLYQVFSGFTTGQVTFGMGSVKDVCPEWFGAIGNAIVNDSGAINLSISSISSTGGIVFFSSKNYKVTSPVNASNLGNVKIILRGTGGSPIYNTVPTSGSNIYGVTGTQAVIECQGSKYFTIEDIGIYSLSTDVNRSAIGIFTSRTTSMPFPEFQEFRRVNISLASIPTANYNRGSIAFYNISSESSLHINCNYISDTPLYLSDNNAFSYVPTYTSLYVLASMSNTEFIMTEFVAIGGGSLSSAAELRGVIDANWENCYYGVQSGTYLSLPAAVQIFPGYYETSRYLKFNRCLMENWNTFLALYDSSADDFDIDISIGTPGYSPAFGLIALLENNIVFTNLKANIYAYHPAAVKLVDCDGASSVVLNGGSLTLNNSQSINNGNITLVGTQIQDLNTTAAVVNVSANSTWIQRNANGVPLINSGHAEFYSTGIPSSTVPWSTMNWGIGDRAWSTGVTSTTTPGWVCTSGDTPGVWTALPNL